MTDTFLGPPPLSDKLADWNALAEAGGEALLRGKDVLDVGPAYGLDAFMFAFYARSYIVIDRYPVSLEQVRLIAPKVTRAICSDLRTRWPVADASHDTVLDFSTIDDVMGGAAVAQHCYREAARVLRPGGTLVTSYANAIVCTDADPYASRTPDALAILLETLGLTVHHRSREDQARAVMFATKETTP